jgi:hypothetical protein
MRRSTKLILVSLISVGLILGGITLAYAANAGGNSAKTKTGNGSINLTATGLLGKGFMFGDRGAILSDIATYLGISEDTLRTDMQNGQTLAQIAVANGKTESGLVNYIVTTITQNLQTALNNNKITQDQFNQMTENLTTQVTNMVETTQPMKGQGLQNVPLSDIATYLGISEDTLRTDMQNGQTLAQIAVANSKTEADLISYIVTQRTNELNTLLTNGKITQTQYDNMVKNMESEVTKMVETNMTSFKDGFRAGFEKGFKMGENCATSMNDIANYIGISLDTLQTDLKNGQTLAQIAVANSKTEADLISYIVTQRTNELNTLLTNGKITQDQFNQMTQNLTTQVTNMVKQTWTGKMGPGGMFGKGGKGAGSAFFPGL